MPLPTGLFFQSVSVLADIDSSMLQGLRSDVDIDVDASADTSGSNVRDQFSFPSRLAAAAT
jgi:hypothetical protein